MTLKIRTLQVNHWHSNDTRWKECESALDKKKLYIPLYISKGQRFVCDTEAYDTCFVDPVDVMQDENIHVNVDDIYIADI